MLDLRSSARVAKMMPKQGFVHHDTLTLSFPRKRESGTTAPSLVLDPRFRGGDKLKCGTFKATLPRHDSLCWSVSLHTSCLGRSAAANVVEGTVRFVRDLFQRLVLLPAQSTLDDDAFVFLLDRLVDCEARFQQLAVDALQRRDHEEQMLRQGVSLDDRSPVARLCEMFSQRPGVLDLVVDPRGCLCEEADGIG